VDVARPALPGVPLDQLPALLGPAYVQTLIMVGLAMILVFGFGLPLGILVHNSGPRGLFPRRRLNRLLGIIVNVGRSLPFLVLMAAIIPFTLLLTGTTIGIPAAVVPMVVAGTPFFARLVENCLRDRPWARFWRIDPADYPDGSALRGVALADRQHDDQHDRHD
jgi:ABC-type methionine transport system permease subunit